MLDFHHKMLLLVYLDDGFVLCMVERVRRKIVVSTQRLIDGHVLGVVTEAKSGFT